MQAIELYTEVTDKQEIHLKLPDDALRGKVKVIVLYNKINQHSSTGQKRKFGQFKGKIHISEDFDSALPDAFWMSEES